MKIISINKTNYKGKVYNLHLRSNDVENDDLYWIEKTSGIINHNCFPKDINALIYLAKSMGVDMDLMEKAWEINMRIREDIDWANIEGAVSEE